MVKMVNRWGNVHVTVTERRAQYLESVGYKRVEESNQGDTEGVNLDKMKVAELEAYAQLNGIDLEGCSNRNEKLAKIKEALKTTDE